MVLSGLLGSCSSGSNQTASQKARSQAMMAIYEKYDKLTSDFIISDATKAAVAAQDVKKALGNIDSKSVSADDMKPWNDLTQKANPELDSIIQSKDIKQQRIHFAILSQAIYIALKAIGISGQTIYYQHCPMFNQDHGGSYWLSKQEDINNPYFGNDMLNCGETVESLKSK